MIYGIVASEAGSQPAPPGGEGLGSFDFINGIYQWSGTTLTSGQVTDQTGWISPSGLSVPASQSAGAEILYAAAQTLLATCAFSAVIEVETLDATGWATVMTVADTESSYYVRVAVWPTGEWDVFDSDGTVNRDASEYTEALSVGIHKLAMTRTDTAVSLSVDGNAVVTDTNANTLPHVGNPMVDFYLGGWSDNTQKAIKIRSVTFYDVQADSALPGLSS